jgi:hypothetical protein
LRDLAEIVEPRKQWRRELLWFSGILDRNRFALFGGALFGLGETVSPGTVVALALDVVVGGHGRN